MSRSHGQKSCGRDCGCPDRGEPRREREAAWHRADDVEDPEAELVGALTIAPDGTSRLDYSMDADPDGPGGIEKADDDEILATLTPEEREKYLRRQELLGQLIQLTEDLGLYDECWAEEADAEDGWEDLHADCEQCTGYSSWDDESPEEIERYNRRITFQNAGEVALARRRARDASDGGTS